MSKSNLTKKALISSVMALVLCATMLLGTTFAWFTDTVTSAGNVINSGTLDVDLVDAEDNSLAGEVIEFVKAEGAEDEEILWEPGCTYKMEPVYVVNNGNLALKYKIAINGIDGDAKLLEAIEWTVKIGDDEVDLSTFEGELLPGEGQNKSDAIVLSGHMKEEAGNEYQGLTAEGISIAVYATQLPYEYDSFDNQYDADASYDYWDGTIPSEMPETLIVNGSTQTITVKDAEAFAYLSTLTAKWAELYTDGNGTAYSNYANGAGAAYYYTWRWTVELETSIDLCNRQMNPIDLIAGAAFDGNSNFISNINSTGALFENNDSHDYTALTLDTVTAIGGALVASSNGNITDVTVKNATISGTDYVGGLVGYAYSTVIGCTVEDSTIVASGKEAGGLIGYIATSFGGEVANNEVRNAFVFANNRAAGLIAQVNKDVKVYNNTIDTVTVGVEDDSTYQPDYVVSNRIVPENIYDNTVINCRILEGGVATANGLATAIAEGNDVTLVADIANVDANNVITVASGNDVTLDLNGHKISATASKTGNQELFLVKGTMTVKNGTLELTAENNQAWNSMATIFDVTAGGVLTMENVTANVGGTDMNFVVHLNNWGEVTLNVNYCDFTTTYVAVRAFNSGPDMNNVTIENTDFHGGRMFWVHNYISEGKDDSTLNLNIYNKNNTSDNAKPIRFGFSSSTYFDLGGNEIN